MARDMAMVMDTGMAMAIPERKYANKNKSFTKKPEYILSIIIPINKKILKLLKL